MIIYQNYKKKTVFCKKRKNIDIVINVIQIQTTVTSEISQFFRIVKVNVSTRLLVTVKTYLAFIFFYSRFETNELNSKSKNKHLLMYIDDGSSLRKI